MLLPLPEKLWNRYTAAHLLNRAGFGGTPGEIDALKALGPEGAVNALLDAREEGDLYPKPESVQPGLRHRYKLRIRASRNREEAVRIRQEMNGEDRDAMLELRQLWLKRMRTTTAPLVEKATLFWHGHFATSFQKVHDSYMMWRQNETLRSHALGKFPELLKAVSRDPAMIKWLDLDESRRNHPNENFAREVMELFSLGEGNYTEKDVQEAARAFTGYRVDPATSTFVYRQRDFDGRQKVFFDRRGPFNGDQILDMIVEQPQCARFIAWKLLKFFVTDAPPESLVNEVSDLLLNNGYDIGETLRVLFRSSVFYSPQVVQHQIKGPVQWMIQTTRMLEMPLPDAKVLESSLFGLGQVLYAPPNVKGWDGGRSWISSSSLLFRYNLAAYLLSGKARIRGSGKSQTPIVPLITIVPTSVRKDPHTLLECVGFRVFNAPIPPRDLKGFLGYLQSRPVPYDDATVRDLMQIMMSTPSFQLV